VLLYTAFNGSAGNPSLVVPATLLAVIALTGILLNASVVYVTLRAKTLRGTCHYLIGLECAAEA
jgi:hypothetical protein